MRSIIHSYWNDDYFYIDAYGNLFPSPCRVLFILIVVNRVFKAGASFVFPSPYGVSFLLIWQNRWWVCEWVSCFRLLTEYHSFLLTPRNPMLNRIYLLFPSPYGVSFILIGKNWDFSSTTSKHSFRLLTEYHSFLF